MGVYIDIEMPKSCHCELIGIGYDMYCSFVGGNPYRLVEYYKCCQDGTRPEWCPLKSVPPHGLLVDADANLAVMRKVLNTPYTSNGKIDTAMLRACILMFEESPTIIEAEEGE